MVSLIAVRNAVRTARIISLTQLSQQFDSEPQWLLILLDDLIKRGKIERCEMMKICSQECQGCQTTTLDITYRWCDEQIAIANI
ncbi:FeoC like transcriptional regulator [Photobacterium piscicola]|uniref:FeoC like transcriptional regulator n=1 Tax=Photobacterium piscicola TaxID=1378299 RepID=A0A1T5HUP4_9GAMM|nr:FeoC-like transcriptional regulator [Photobacterium piscicola]SKC30538.1 FeoC like transcriptional regulator [Photobacterium piscicola]